MEAILIFSSLIVLFLLAWFFYDKRKKQGKFALQAINESQPTNDKALKIVLIVLSVLYIGFYFFRLFSVDYFLGVSVTKPSSLFTNGEIVWATILRFMTQGLCVIVMIVPFFKVKNLNNILAIIGTPIFLLNMIFFRLNLMAFEGANYSFFSWRAIEFAIECSIGLIICGIYLINKIYSKDFKQFHKQMPNMFVVWFALCFAMIFQCTLYNLFGANVPEADGFTLTHRICLYITFGSGLAIFFSLRKKDYGARYCACLMMSIAGIVSFFTILPFDMPLTQLPMNFCNAALIMSLFSYAFRTKKLFYFTFFVNVLGALLSLTMPNTDGSILTVGNFRFWTDHFYAFTLPLLGVGLKIFPRPNLKMMRNAIIVFVIYYFVAIGSNMIISNYEPGVDYFFLNSDFFIDKFPWAYPLKANYTYMFSWMNLNFTIYPVYWAIILAVYLAGMFGIWLVYAYIFKISDEFQLLFKLDKEDSMDMLKFKKELKAVKKGGDTKKSDETIVEISHFTKIYGSSKVAAVDDFNLTINKGEVFGFLGHNGAGKSTLIKSMVGIQSITGGKINICGFDIEHQPLEAKLNIGYVSDNHAVYEKLTGREYVNFVADLYLVSKEDRDARLAKYAKLFELEDAIDREIKGYSHGMKQKLVVIASIIHNPKVWILDEPLTGLDPMSSIQIKNLMREFANEGHIVFFSSHVIEVVEKICDKIAIISRGKMVGVYTIDELKEKNLTLEELYLNKAEKKPVKIDIVKKKKTSNKKTAATNRRDNNKTKKSAKSKKIVEKK